jgi:hypothetical protein
VLTEFHAIARFLHSSERGKTQPIDPRGQSIPIHAQLQNVHPFLMQTKFNLLPFINLFYQFITNNYKNNYMEAPENIEMRFKAALRGATAAG